MSQWDLKGQTPGLNALGKSEVKNYSSVKKCEVHECRGKAPTFYLYTCRHVLCTRCLVKTRTSVFQKGKDVCICTLCRNARYPAWLEYNTLVTELMHMQYCTSCLAEKAVFKSKCGHLMCQNCLKEIDRTHTSAAECTCPSFGCKQEMPYSELREGLENMTDTMIWSVFNIPSLEYCDESLCRNKAIVNIKECGHCYCFPCCDLKISNSATDKSETISCLKRYKCATIISRDLLEAFLKKFKEIPLMTAISLKVSIGKCQNENCRQKNLDVIRMRNKLCSHIHVYCIACLEEKLESSDYVEEPYMQSNCVEDLIRCIANNCKTRTPVKCLEAVINVVEKKDTVTVLFLRRAIFLEECGVCRKTDALATCMLCSHGFCRQCMEDILEANDQEYYICDVKYCTCLLPMVVVKNFLKRTSSKISSDSNAREVKDVDISTSARPPEILLQISIDKMNRSFILNAEVKSTSIFRNSQWLKDNRPLDFHSLTRYKEEGMLTTTPTLEICSVRQEDEGSYRLVLTSANQTVFSNCVEFTISKVPPSVSIKYAFDTNHQQGIVIADIETEWPVEHVHWLYRRKQINRTDMGKKFIEDASSFRRKQRTLYIKNFERSDEGEYACEVETIAGKGTSPPVLIRIPKAACEPEILLQISIDKMNRSFVLNAEVKSTSGHWNAQWWKNSKPLDIRHQTRYMEVGMPAKTPKLTIHGLRKEDEGSYRLILSNANETVFSNDVEFSIGKDLPSVLIKVDFDGNQQRGILIADIETEWPIEHVHWFYKRKQISRTDMGKKFTEVASSSRRKEKRLYIRNLQRSDEGEYACEVETIAGKGTSPPVFLTIPKDQPSVSIKADFDDTHQQGIVIADIETKWPVERVHWLYKGKQINRTDIGKKFKEDTSLCRKNQRTLYIKNIQRSDEGEYACEVETIAGKGMSPAVLITIPKVVPSVSLSLSLNEKRKSFLLSAEVVSSSPTKPPKWIKDGKQMPLNIKPQKYLETSHLPAKPSITVFDVGKDDEGLYRVSVENEHGLGISETIYFRLPSQIREADGVKTQSNASKSYACTEKLTYEEMIYCQNASYLDGIKRPYIDRVSCGMCCRIAIATFRNCGHSYCLECLQCIAGTCATTIMTCPKEGGCSSFVTKDAFREFVERPNVLHMEMPLYFKVAFGKCMGTACSKEGIIQMTICNHSLCLACLEKCKSKDRCASGDCINTDIPPARYFDYLKHVFGDMDANINQIPYLLQVSRDADQADIKCSSCSERALFEIIPCTHKFCDRCSGRRRDFPDLSFVIRNCEVNGCYVWYPFPMKLHRSDRPKDITGSQAQEKKTEERQTNPAIEHLSFGASRGLRNIAFSCYRNSILQILAETPKFYDHLLESYSTETENWIPLLKDILLRIRNQMTAGKEMVDILCHFHSEFNISNTEYKEYQQEDTLSFLTTVLNGINDRYGQMGKEGITAFKGRLRHRFYCKKCGKEDGSNDDDFLSLPLPTESTVEKCLLEFLQEESIDALSCSHCGSQPISKQLQICKYPDVLVLQLNKSTSSFSRAVKVKFPESLKNMEDKDLMKIIKKKDIWSYKLYGVVVHSGNEYSGHYISYVRRQSKSSWDKCDDSYVTPVSVKDVLRCDPYLLFYEKCDSEV